MLLKIISAVLFVTPLFAATLSSPVVPPGGTAHITLTLPTPQAIAAGSLSIDLDPAVFDNITAVNVFSASGDQIGVVRVQGRRADIDFASPSGGIGRLPLYPVLQLTVPVLSSARPGTLGRATAQAKAPWRDITGKDYPVTFQSPGIPIGPGLSIQSVLPAGDVLPAGTRVQIHGQGFSPATAVQMDGIAWQNLEFVNPRQLVFTLSGPADLTGRQISLSDPSGAQTRYFAALPLNVTRQAPSIPESIQPIFPLTSVRRTTLYSSGSRLALQNPTANPVTLRIESGRLPAAGRPQSPVITMISVDPRSTLLFEDRVPGRLSTTVVVDAPIRILELYPDSSTLSEFRALSPGLVLPDNYLNWSLRPSDPPLRVPLDGKFSEWPPSPRTVTIGTGDSSPWLSAASSAGGVTLTVNPAGLSPGTYSALVIISGPSAAVPPLQIVATLTVDPEPLITASTTHLEFPLIEAGATQTFRLSSDSPSVPFQLQSSAPWLSLTTSSTTTPATVTATITNPEAYSHGKVVSVQGPRSILHLSAGSTGFSAGSPPAFTFAAPQGSITMQQARFNVSPVAQPFAADVTTNSGGNWLTTGITSGPGVPGLAIQVDPTNLAAGTYIGTVTVRSAPGAPIPLPAPVAVAVTLVVWDNTTPQPAVSPSRIELTAPANSSVLSERVKISTSSTPLPYSGSLSSNDSSNWLDIPLLRDPAPLTPDILPITVYPRSLPPGTYRSSVIVTSPPQSNNSVTVPVTLNITPALATPAAVAPMLTALVNGASLLPGAIAPGEIVSLFGDLGAAANAGPSIGATGHVRSDSYGTRVFFNGVAAPLTYVSRWQINAVVPYEVAGPSATVEIERSGTRTAVHAVPVAAASPALFTQSGSGQGAAAILNQDNSLNTSANPAARGSIIQVFATGEGHTIPAATTGEVTQTNLKTPLLHVSATIGNREAGVLSATAAPNAIAGLFQVNIRIPNDAPAGSVPVVLRLGNYTSPASATVAIK